MALLLRTHNSRPRNTNMPEVDMKARSIAVGSSAALVLVALLGAGVFAPVAPVAKSRGLDATPLSDRLRAAVARGDTPGVTALVVDRDGVLYEGAAGKLDVEGQVPMAIDAIFNIASMTKPVTSGAIMMVLEESKLRLDEPVSKFL